MIRLFIYPFYTMFFCLLFVAQPKPQMKLAFNQASTPSTTALPTQTQLTIPGSQTPTSTPAYTTTITPTTTLIPLPPITLVFPAKTDTPTPTNTAINIREVQTPTPAPSENGDNISPRLRILFIILVLLWIFLAGYLVIYIRQLY